MSKFDFQASQYVPFRDKEIIAKCRAIKREDIEKHSNPHYNIKVYKDADMRYFWVTDMFVRIKNAAEAGEKIVIILPNPCPAYKYVAHLLNMCKINCKNLYGFAMDEYADEKGNIAPESWEFGFSHAMYKYFWSELDEAIRPPKSHFTCFTNSNLKDYGKMITDLGGADVCYSGPGWTGHLAFIDPDAREFATSSIEEWKTFGPRIVTLSPFTLAQNSLYGAFGKSGDLSAVPPKAATIGPAQVVEAKSRVQTMGITVHGTTTAWQRMIARLVMHGPVTPLVPESLLQELGAKVMVTETIAQNIEPDWDKGY